MKKKNEMTVEELKRSIASYKAANTRQGNTIAKMREQINALEQEKKLLEDKIDYESAQSAGTIATLRKHVDELTACKNSLTDEKEALKMALEWEQKPWWQKLF